MSNEKKNIKCITDFFQKPTSSSCSASNISYSGKDSPPPKRYCVVRRYNPDYLKYGFISSPESEEDFPRPQCVICREILSNECMKPAKLARYLQTKHSNLQNKPLEFFEGKSAEFKNQMLSLKKFLLVDKSFVKASYLVALRIAKCKKAYSIAEDLIKPCLIDVCSEILGTAAADKMKTLPLSNDTIQRRISELATDVEYQLIQKVSKSLFAIQLDESTDITNKAILLCYVRYIDYEINDIKEDFFCCLELFNHTTSAEIFKAIDNYIERNSLNWKNCIGLCTDGAASMTGKHSGVAKKIKDVADEKMIFTHCIIHREHLACKKLSPDLNTILIQSIKIINYIKNNALNSRLFSKLCNEMGSEHEHLLIHAEVRWLSRGRILTRLYELRKEVETFLETKNSELKSVFLDHNWIAKLAYLSDIFSLINDLNLTLQGNDATTFDLWNKIEAFKKKLLLWCKRVKENNYDMFHSFSEYINEADININNLKTIVVEHVTALSFAFDQYYPKEDDIRRGNMWILNPFVEQENTVTDLEQEKLIELSCDATLQVSFKSLSITQFWVKIRSEYPELHKKAMGVLLPFPTTYLCESTFSAMTSIKTKQRNRMNINSALRMAVTNIVPRIDKLINEKHKQHSH